MILNDISTNQNYNSHIVERVHYIEPTAITKAHSSESVKIQKTASTASTASNFKELRQAEQQGEIVSISDEQLVKAIEKAIKAAEGITTSLEFSIHKATHQISIKVLDKETREVIREIPPEKNLDFLATLWRKAGILIDEKR